MACADERSSASVRSAPGRPSPQATGPRPGAGLGTAVVGAPGGGSRAPARIRQVPHRWRASACSEERRVVGGPGGRPCGACRHGGAWRGADRRSSGRGRTGGATGGQRAELVADRVARRGRVQGFDARRLGDDRRRLGRSRAAGRRAGRRGHCPGAGWIDHRRGRRPGARPGRAGCARRPGGVRFAGRLDGGLAGDLDLDPGAERRRGVCGAGTACRDRDDASSDPRGQRPSHRRRGRGRSLRSHHPGPVPAGRRPGARRGHQRDGRGAPTARRGARQGHLGARDDALEQQRRSGLACARCRTPGIVRPSLRWSHGPPSTRRTRCSSGAGRTPAGSRRSRSRRSRRSDGPRSWGRLRPRRSARRSASAGRRASAGPHRQTCRAWSGSCRRSGR